MTSSAAAMLLMAMALLSVFVAEASVDKVNEGGGINQSGISIRSSRRKPASNKAKLESMVRGQNLLPPLIHDEDLPMDNAEEKWQSLNENVEFIPADGVDPRLVHRFLEQGNYDQDEADDGRMSGMEDIYDVEPFAYGVDEYDEYQQAWRLMGFIVDCNPMVDDDYYRNGGSGSGDEGTEDGCARYVLWAAVSSISFYCNGIQFSAPRILL